MIVFFEIADWETDLLKSLDHNMDFKTTPDPLTAENAHIYKSAEVISTFIYSDLDARTLDRLPNLKMISTRSTGTDHIDLDYCKKRGITVCNVPAYGEHTVAEHVFALILALSRHIPQAAEHTRNGGFSFEAFCGFDLFGKTIGLIGVGAIGHHVARIAQGFGMNVIGYDLQETYQDIEYKDLNDVLKTADILSIHIPATAKTKNMISTDAFNKMKDGVVLINTARGSIIDIKALLSALESGKVCGAGLDVLPEEPLLREEAELLSNIFSKNNDLETLILDHALAHHKNVIITPHSAFYTKEAVKKIIETTDHNINAFLKGCPENTVSK